MVSTRVFHSCRSEQGARITRSLTSQWRVAGVAARGWGSLVEVGGSSRMLKVCMLLVRVEEKKRGEWLGWKAREGVRLAD